MRALVLAALLFVGNAFALNSITAQSWLIADDNGVMIQGENPNEVRSIASITKLMTVMAVIDHQQNMDEKIGQYTRGQLIQLALVKSDNNAADQLCKHFPGGRFHCIQYMNEKAKFIGMENTKFVEPTGLSPMNISTAYDLIKLVLVAQYYDSVIDAAKQPNVALKVKKKTVNINNTNPLTKTYNFLVSKTGTTRAAGGCIVLLVKTEYGSRVVVLLGSKNGKTRIPEAEKIVLQG